MWLTHVLSQRPTDEATFLIPPRPSDSNTDDNYLDCAKVVSFMEASPDHPLTLRIQESVGFIRDSFKRFGVLTFSFNGGKDSVVLFHLLRLTCFLDFRKHDAVSPGGFFRDRISLFYLHNEPQFPELVDFFITMLCDYQMEIRVFSETSFKRCIEASHNYLKYDAVFLGTRKTDPHGNCEVFAPGTPGWPKLIRINAVLNWTYVDVWDFLLRNKYPYCSLYDYGFTSLGAADNTIQNPNLCRRGLRKIVSHARFKRASHAEDVTLTDGEYLSSEAIEAPTVLDKLIERGLEEESLMSVPVNTHPIRYETCAPAYFLSVEDSEYDRVGRSSTHGLESLSSDK